MMEEQKQELREAISSKDYEKLNLLLSDVNINVINSMVENESALDLAVSKGNRVAVELLLSHGAIPDYERPIHIWPQSTLSRAILKGNREIIQLLVNHGCDPDTNLETNIRLHPVRHMIFPDYWYKIVELKNLPILQLLLECKGREIQNDEWSQRMLLTACGLGSRVIVEYLLNQGVSIESIDRNGWTSLFYAIIFECISIFDLLINRGAYLGHKDFKGRNLLHVVVERSDKLTNPLNIIQLLINRGVEINATDNNGLTPINTAFVGSYFNYNVIYLFLRQTNVDFSTPDIHGMTVLHHAVAWRNQKIIKRILCQPNVDINARNKEGKTPLQCIETYNSENFRLLVECGANTEVLHCLIKSPRVEIFFNILAQYRLKRIVAGLSEDENVNILLSKYDSFLNKQEEIDRLKFTYLEEIQRMNTYR